VGVLAARPKRSVEEGKVHFDVEGRWFTWFLRHLWFEGNEVKAIKMWCAAFPEHSSVEAIKDLFLSLVTGKKKFDGWASDDGGFNYVDDGTKYWNPHQGAPDEMYPLLQSWEDVILLKKARLFVNELLLRRFRLGRQYPDSLETANYNAMYFDRGCQENQVENGLRVAVNKYWTDVRNISYFLQEAVELPLIPDEPPLLSEIGCRKIRRYTSEGDCNRLSSVELNQELYRKAHTYVSGIRKYFVDKYGYDMLHVDEHELLLPCGISGVEFDDAEHKKIAKKLTKSNGVSELVANVARLAGVPALSVENFVQQSIKESERKDLAAEQVDGTEWQSGYIDREGAFYGCADVHHGQMAKGLICEQHIKSLKDEDPETTLDRLGWVKISMHRFFWDSQLHLTDPQKKTILEWMVSHDLKEAVFNHHGRLNTFDQAVKEM
jgi:hypothetical protein